jgi:hypothetical protein
MSPIDAMKDILAFVSLNVSSKFLDQSLDDRLVHE